MIEIASVFNAYQAIMEYTQAFMIKKSAIRNILSEVTKGTYEFYSLTQLFKSQWLLQVPLVLMLKISVFSHRVRLSV